MTLTGAERRAYDEICRQLDAMAAEIVLPGLKYDDVKGLFPLALDNRPDFFWLTGAADVVTEHLGSDTTVIITPKWQGTDSARQVAMQRQNLAKKADALVQQAKRTTANVYGQILYLHDALVKNTDYIDNGGHCFDAYGCLIEGQAVCAGYAAAFMLLMQKLGVVCGKTRGRSAAGNRPEESHVWNYIRLDDGYYFVDVTWDDPLIRGGAVRDSLSREFFCLDLKDLKLTHRMSDGQLIPRNYGTKYQYYRYMGRYFLSYSYEEVKAAAVKQLRTDGYFSVKFSSAEQTKRAEKDLIDGNKVYSIPGVTNHISYNVSKSGLILNVWLR